MTVSDAPPLRIATRASRLAMWQAEYVSSLLRKVAPEREVELVEVSTIGDRDRSEPLSQMGGMGVFTREVQTAVLDGRADMAVHSLKDLPTETVEGLVLAGVPERGPRFDVLVLPKSQEGTIASLDDLPQGTRIGTGSLRRQAQLLHARPDLQMAEIRGNVETRLRKLDDGEYDAIVLAQAGLERLGLNDHFTIVLHPPLMFPAVGQAALGIECRRDDEETASLLQQLSHAPTLAEVTAERACLHELRAGCHAPVGVVTEIGEDDQLRLQAVVLSGDGRELVEATVVGEQSSPAQLGRQAATELSRAGADKLLAVED
ncbi:MAG: hydroxymethylbilane synthase [Planctomycetaceae bacterium]|nr:hydroxymethylbilane synthase [Planctomycetaceae bacterium]